MFVFSPTDTSNHLNFILSFPRPYNCIILYQKQFAVSFHLFAQLTFRMRIPSFSVVGRGSKRGGKCEKGHFFDRSHGWRRWKLGRKEEKHYCRRLSNGVGQKDHCLHGKLPGACVSGSLKVFWCYRFFEYLDLFMRELFYVPFFAPFFLPWF